MKANTRINDEGIKEKQCTKCGKWFPETTEYFYMRNKNKPELGYTSECKKCLIKRSFEVTKKNPERRKQYLKKANAKPKRKQDLRDWTKKRRHNGYYKQYYLKNQNKFKKYNKRRRLKNHEISEEEWLACKKYFNNSCAYCGLPQEKHLIKRKGKIINIDLHKEHVDNQGSNYLNNCVPSCYICNSLKSTHTLDEFYNINNPNFTQERYNKIIQWITTDYKQFINKY